MGLFSSISNSNLSLIKINWLHSSYKSETRTQDFDYCLVSVLFIQIRLAWSPNLLVSHFLLCFIYDAARIEYLPVSGIQNWLRSRMFYHKRQPTCKLSTEAILELLWQLESLITLSSSYFPGQHAISIHKQ